VNRGRHIACNRASNGMNDAWFAYGHLALWGIALAIYAIHVATHGVFRSDRVERIGGGTPLVGRSVMDATYWILVPIVAVLVRARITPDQLTWSSLVFGIGAAIAVARGWFGLAGLLMTMSMFLDMLDGQVARVTQVSSMQGEVLDSAVDRYGEMVYLGGLALYVHDTAWQLAIVIGAIVASFMVSYVGVMADAMKVTVPRGLMRRHERGVYLIVGTSLVPLIGPALHGRWGVPIVATALLGCAVVAVVGNVAAVQRFVRIRRALG
jgi:CDP-diacylglycerol---glycerol-3-phosphate 3-phosphatidyltransferase